MPDLGAPLGFALGTCNRFYTGADFQVRHPDGIWHSYPKARSYEEALGYAVREYLKATPEAAQWLTLR